MEMRNFSWLVTSIEQADYIAFCQWYQQNQERLKTHQLVIWGAGIRGTTFSLLLKEREFYNIIFVDTNPQKQGGYIDEFPIISPEELEQWRRKQNTLILVSPENSGEIQAELKAKNYQENKDYFLAESGEYEAYIKEFLRPYSQDTLIMGDCEFSTISMIDVEHSTLQEMLFQRCGLDKTKILAMHGMGLRAEYNIFHAQILQGMKPKRLVIMVNFDTLTGKQHLLPRSQHSELLKQLLSVQKNPDQEFIEYVNLTEERSQKLQMEFLGGSKYTKELSEVRTRNYFKLNYLYNLNIETEGIVYLIRILKEARAEGINVLPFIPPVNYQLGKRLIGNMFCQKYECNVEKVRQVIEAENFYLLDLSYCLDATLFATEMTANETSNSKGREKIADLLYEEIQEMN
ncbi:hypothetical protein D7Y09_14375 [bacterium 1XD42-1]|nr:hypothetical protein D7X25_16510 [bacterium 1XD42-8]RKJ62189.1 hypothetical protein D7Y09_14375 [bacterium 1XD42-1]